MKIADLELVVGFLQGRTFRELDTLCGYDVLRTHGKPSEKRIKRLSLRKADRGALFTFTKAEVGKVAGQVIAAKSRSQVDAILTNAWPRKFDAFRIVVVLAPNDHVFCKAFSGVFCNITKAFYEKDRRSRDCQHRGCTYTGVLHTAHLREERPKIVRRVSRQYATKGLGGGYRYPLDRVVRRYLEEHRPKGSVAFLCPLHHRHQEQAAKRGVKAARAYMKNLLP